MKPRNQVQLIGCAMGLTLAIGAWPANAQTRPSAPASSPAPPMSPPSAAPISPEPGTREYYEQKIKGHYALDGGELVSIVSVRDLPPGLTRYTSAPGVSRPTSFGTYGANPAGARWIEGPVMQIVSNRLAVIGKTFTQASGAVRIDPSCLIAMREDRKSDAGNERRFLAVSDGQYRTAAQSGVEGRLPAYREVSEPSFDDYAAIYQRDCQATVDPIVSMEIATSAAPGEVGRPLTTFSTSSPPLQALSPEEIQRREEMRIRRDEARRKRGEERKKQAEALARMTPQERERRLRDLNLELIINDSGSPLPIELDEKDIAKLKAAGFDVPGK